MNVLQHNIQSLNKNKSYLEIYLKKYLIDICFLSEIFNVDETKSNSYLQNYYIISKKRQDNYGGVAIVHKKDIKIKQIKFESDLDILICQTLNLSTNVTLVSVYFPHSVKCNVLKDELIKLLVFLEGKLNVFICGDFNARSKTYGDVFDTVRGSAVKSLFEGSTFRCLNDGNITFKKSLIDNSTGSVLDLSFTNTSMPISWKVLTSTIGGSHHFPILCTINSIEMRKQSFLAKKNLMKNLASVKINAEVSDIQAILKNEIKKSTFTISEKIPKSWWNVNVEKHLRLKIAAEEKFKNYKNATNAEKLTESIKDFKKAVKKAKKLAKISKVTHLSKNPNSKALFRYVQNCKSTLESRNPSRWCVEDNIKFLEHLKNQVPCNVKKVDSIVYNGASTNFSFDELHFVLSQKTKPSAAGIDGITYEMLYNLSLDAKQNLLSAFNKLWTKCEINSEWRKIKIIPIPKKGKNLELVTNFRPIALISVLAKVMNLMVKQRLNSFITENNILPQRSYAYRKHLSASTCINDLLNTIILQKEKGEKVLILTLDISCAYDCVDLNMLQIIMNCIEIPNQISTWILNFLSQRILVMGMESTEINNGIPQGSCLSPTLFNLYTLALHGIADEKTHIFQFADDFVILTSDKKFEIANEILQSKLQHFSDLLTKLNLQLNIAKTSVMYIAKGARKIPNIHLNRTQVKSVKTIKFLGRHIKNSLSLKEHYDETIMSCRNVQNALKMVTAVKHGVQPAKAVNLTKALVFSKTEYAISSMAHMPTYLNKKITAFQNQILRRNLGLTPSTPNHIVCALAGILPTEQRAIFLAAKELVRLKIHNESLYNSITTNPSKKSSLGFVFIKFKDILDGLRISPNTIKSEKLNIQMNLFNTSKDSMSKEYIISTYRQTLNSLIAEGYAIFATDASINDKTTGCAVCNISCNQNFLFKISTHLSSLTGELQAIDKAIDIIIEDGFSKAVIFTDSKNACHLLYNNTSHNYLANQITEKVKLSEIVTLTVIWIPSHVGITPNETADYFAKNAAMVGCEIPFVISTKDALNQMNQALWKEWENNFKEISISKGTYFSQFFPTPTIQPWHKGFKRYPAKIKIINRLFAGHTYSKKYLHMIGVQQTNLCQECDVIEDENHLFFHCKKYNNQRLRYNIFKQYTNLPALLASKNFHHFDELISFMNRCKIEV